MNTVRMAVQVSNKTSRASQLQVSSSVILVIRTLITSDISIDKKVRVPIGLKYQKQKCLLMSVYFNCHYDQHRETPSLKNQTTITMTL